MPPELEDYKPKKPEGMTELTHCNEYNVVWTAHQVGMIPEAFRMLPCEEQAEMIAFHYVQNMIKSFYGEEQKVVADERARRLREQGKKKTDKRKLFRRRK